jgi:hypothetical protein
MSLVLHARGRLLAGWWTILVLELVQLQSLLGFAACLNLRCCCRGAIGGRGAPGEGPA